MHLSMEIAQCLESLERRASGFYNRSEKE